MIGTPFRPYKSFPLRRLERRAISRRRILTIAAVWSIRSHHPAIQQPWFHQNAGLINQPENFMYALVAIRVLSSVLFKFTMILYENFCFVLICHTDRFTVGIRVEIRKGSTVTFRAIRKIYRGEDCNVEGLSLLYSSLAPPHGGYNSRSTTDYGKTNLQVLS